MKISTPNEVLCFDPGKHTGVALFLDGELAVTETVLPEMPEGLAGLYQRLQFLITSRPEECQIVIENYHTVGPLTTEGLLTIRIMGWLEGLALTHGHPYCFQMPSMKKPWLEEAQRLAKAMYGTRHVRDAIAHGLAWYYRNGNGVARRGGVS